MIGTIVNAGAIIVGGILGVLLRKRLSERVVEMVFQCMGLFVATLGIKMALEEGSNLLVVLTSLVAGGMIGQALDLEGKLIRFSDLIRQRGFSGRKNGAAAAGSNARDTGNDTDAAAESAENFNAGFVNASILFCVGSMAILGAFEEGMGGSPDILYTKSIMDGVGAVAMAATFGLSVALSAFPILVYQGLLTFFAALLMPFMSAGMMADLTSLGGIMLIAIGITILKIRRISITNMLPAIVLVLILGYFFS